MFAIRWKVLALVSFSLAVVTGCSDRPAERFQVDQSLLGPAYSEPNLKVRFQAPAEFQAADAEFVSRSQQAVRAAGQTGPYDIVPAMIFAIPGNDARCFVSAFPNSRGALFDEIWRDGYLAAARLRAGGNSISSEMLKRSDLDILSLTISGPQIFNYRFVTVTPAGDIVQVDYLLPDSLHQSLERAVDSSIGTMTFF